MTRHPADGQIAAPRLPWSLAAGGRLCGLVFCLASARSAAAAVDPVVSASAEVGAWSWLAIGGFVLFCALVGAIFLLRSGTMLFRQKAGLLVVTLEAMVVLLSAIALLQLSAISADVRGTVAVDQPLAEQIEDLASLSVEQALWLGRAYRASAADAAGVDVDILEVARSAFDSLVTQADVGIDSAMALAGSATEPDLRAERGEVLEGLGLAKVAHADMARGGVELFELIRDGDGPGALRRLQALETDQAQLTAELRALEGRVSQRSSMAMAAALSREVQASRAILVISSIGILFTLLLSILVIRDIRRLLGADARDLSDNALLIADGRLDVDWSDAASGVYLALANTITKLREVVGAMRSGADIVGQSAFEVAQGTTNLSQRTQEQASSLEEVAASMEEMTATVNQNADNAVRARDFAATARDQAVSGGEVVNSSIEAMKAIDVASRRIADIIGVIDEIAFQTNLLALNAAVEAARAGEQGRGFAVVASEVRSLAGRSATAAKEIKGLINDSVGKVEEGARLVDASGDALADIVASVSEVSQIVAEIAAASQEQSSGINQVNLAVSQMDEMTQENAALVEESAAAAEAMGIEAERLLGVLDFFTVAANAAPDSRAQFDGRAPAPRREPMASAARAGGSAVAQAPGAAKGTPDPRMLNHQDSEDDGEWREF